MDTPSGFALTLWATDVYALADFIQAVSGFQVAERHPGFAVLRGSGVEIQVHADESYRGHPWYDALAREGVARGIGAEIRIQIADVLSSYRTALARGATAIAQPFEFEGTLECQVMGPDGYVLALWQVWESSTTV